MLPELKALLARYCLSYFRVRSKPFQDFLVAIIMGGLLLVRNINVVGLWSSWIFCFMFPVTHLALVRSMLSEIVEEKSTGAKEYLKLNGIGSFTYQLYIAVLTNIKTMLFSLFIIAGFFLGSLITPKDDWIKDIYNIDAITVIELAVFGALGTASFILFLSVFFSDPKAASSIGGMLYVVLSVMCVFTLSVDSPFAVAFFGLFPQGALLKAFGYFTLYKNRETTSVVLFHVKLILLVDWILYRLLHAYLDQVVADEHGVSKSMFFCCQRKKQRRVVSVPAETSDMGLSTQLINQESLSEDDWSSAVFHEGLNNRVQSLKKTVQINHLIKKFNKFTAVDDISFSIYAGQIFCLLGHNGAGKTTTIKTLTGLLESDSGDVFYDGEDFVSNMEEVRKKIGICAQNDILFEKLTVREHLELIAKVRGIPFFDIPEAVDNAISKLNLGPESRKFPEELSGGNKRKLSLAMAILGQTKVIFLDEPTSGMDPQTRRILWEILKHLKEQGLTILLTTHHLDEADELADRVAIMSKGKLLAMGTCEYFKKNFGVGYHLSITPIYEKIDLETFCALKEELKGLVSGVIPEAQFDEQTAKDVLKCSLPFITQKESPKLFAELETKENLRISVEMNTLEDVYVNIGLSEEKLLRGRNLLNNDHHNAEININTQPPECLKEPVIYSFSAQMFAIAKRRVLLLTRSKRNLVLVLLPLFLMTASFGMALLISSRNQQRFDISSSLDLFGYVCFFAFVLNTAAYCYLPVYEREEKLKYLMDAMGLRNLAYWIGNLLVDFSIMTFLNLAMSGFYAILYYVFYRDHVYTNSAPEPLMILMFMVVHGLALITMGYAYSFMYDKALSTIKFFPIFYFCLFIFSMYINLPTWFSFRSERITSQFALLFGCFLCPSTLVVLAFAASQNLYSLFSPEICALALLVYSVFYFGVAILLGSRRLSLPTGARTSGQAAHETQVTPVNQSDVDAEKNRTMQTLQDPIQAVNISKVYGNGYAAVKGVTFGVAPGEIFGLLGPNGAGKSTSFNLLTTATAKSRGSVKLLGQEIDRNMPEVFENVGVCPQFNAFWDVLTVKEHLILFGKLKGLKDQSVNQVVNYYMDTLLLQDHANKRACELSGGNKRKLCVACAFIGSASLIFLDEPSTGVDPIARKFMWNSLQEVLKMRQASVVLTTHSMSEAESLCHKIGILVNGRFVCIGSTQYLKDKYSQGYKITIPLIPEGGDPESRIMEMFPNATKLQEPSNVTQTYDIPIEGFKFSKAFEKLDVLKQEGAIQDFSLYNTTLEQIFIYFSRFQTNMTTSN